MKNFKIGFWGLIGILVMIYVIREPLGVFGGLFFEFLDRLLFISNDVSPVTMWAVFGSLSGLIYGTFVSIKKYNLDMKLIILPIGVLVIVINLILLTSSLLS